MLQRLHELRSLQEKEEKLQKKILPDSSVRHFAAITNGNASEKEMGEPAVEIIDESMDIGKSEIKCGTSEAVTDGKTPTKNDTAGELYVLCLEKVLFVKFYVLEWKGGLPFRLIYLMLLPIRTKKDHYITTLYYLQL